MATYKEVIALLADFGLVDVILPFILVFVVTYGILRRTQVLGKQKNYAGMVAFIFGFLAILVTNVVTGINIVLSSLILVPIFGLLLALIIGFIGGKVESKAYKLAMAIVFFLAAGAGIKRAGFIDPRFADTLLWPLFILGVLIGGGIYLFGPKKKNEKKEEKGKKAEPVAPKPSAVIDKPQEKSGVLWSDK
ncbi:hypothetical protein J4211_05435 [Candidatus Woesearchaeota archaeon]|nr:hypothetical protein [Candidatus Woesearchaeota archaeon]